MISRAWEIVGRRPQVSRRWHVCCFGHKAMRTNTQNKLFLSASLSFALLAAACGAPEIDGAAVATTGVVEDDVAFAPDHDNEVPFQPSATATQIIFLNFGGGTINGCPSTNRYCSDATTNRSWLVNNAGRTSVQLAHYPLADRAAVTSYVAQRYAPYNASVVSTRPTSGSYTMVMVSSGASSFIGSVGTYGYRGQAPVDCWNSNKNDIAFLFTNNIGGASLANGLSHEAGHSFGLVHITTASDIMLATNPGSRWQTGPINGSNFCNRSGGQQSDTAVLTTNLGARL